MYGRNRHLNRPMLEGVVASGSGESGIECLYHKTKATNSV